MRNALFLQYFVSLKLQQDFLSFWTGLSVHGADRRRCALAASTICHAPCRTRKQRLMPGCQSRCSQKQRSESQWPWTSTNSSPAREWMSELPAIQCLFILTSNAGPEAIFPAKQIRTRDVLPALLLCSKAGVKSVWLSFGRVSVSYHTTAQAGLLYIHEIWVRGENDSTIIHSKVVFSER